MKKTYAIIPAIALSIACAVGAEEEPKQQDGAISAPTMHELLCGGESTGPSLEAQQAAMDSYHETPTLEKAAEIVGFPVSDENLTYRMGFYSQLYRQHALWADQLAAAAAKAPGGYNTRFAHCAAEWLSGDDACVRDAMQQLEYDPIMRAYMGIDQDTPRPDFTRLEDLDAGVEESNLLDMAWGAYDATRDKAILLSFIRCAARTGAPEKDAMRFWPLRKDEDRAPMPPEMAQMDVVAMAAKWSVKSRAEQDAAFAAVVQECLSTLPEDVRARFNEPLRPNPRNSSSYTPNP